MTHRPGRLARLAAAAFLAALTLPGVAGPAGAASATAITLEARALVGGRFMTNGWIAISVTLSNDGPPTTGYVGVDSFTFTASDGAATSSPATVSIAVSACASGDCLSVSASVRCTSDQAHEITWTVVNTRRTTVEIQR